MKKNYLMLPILALGAMSLAPAETPSQSGKVGIIHIQNAIIATKDGQKAASELQTRFEPKRKQLEGLQQQISGMQAQLRSGNNTMNDDAKNKLIRDIDEKTKSLNRSNEDAQAELDQEQQKILNELGGKIMVVIEKYAQDHGYSLILDVSSPQTPVLYAANGIDITQDIVKLYDQNAPGAATPAPAAAKPAPAAAPKPAATTPATPAKKPAPPK